ncbi:hypothetical protein RDWZM_007944 [Blomia tropicalis]|uniref:Lysozyme n=1 Tax=Blomia tropicalis TaxID=40697 RepID=A0A9Q0M0U3_BLOTA|nr:hypothetical protein BLOT_003593 [Blomia tropicalis]KAJ6216787.1 hypothetical protein RDWZM_007944 [Blomia tropicalis]
MFKPIAILLLVVAGSFARQINNEGLKLIKSFEGFRANFYKDAVGIKTIGYGHACHANDCSHIHPPITEAQGSALLLKDLVSYENCVEKFVHLDDDKFAAMVSFVYNLGCGSLTQSTIGKYLRQHNYRGAAGQFHLWVHAGGKVLQGLVRRRNAERTLFCKSGGC